MRMRTWALSSVLLAAAFGGTGPPVVGAEPIPPDRLEAIDGYLTSVHEEQGFPGLAFTLIQDGVPVMTRALGVADGGGRRVTPQTPFLLASTSKALTALAVMRLAEAGRLDLDAPVRTVLPWFTLADEEAAGAITPRHLLHHTSGLSEASGTAYHQVDDQDAGALERGVRRLAEEPLEAAPGERFIYSNTNYDILGLLVETVTGRPFSEAMASTVFEPLGMAHAHGTAEAARADGLSEGFYPWLGNDWRPNRVPMPRTGGPSATTFASVEDLGREIMLHLASGTVDGTQVLSPESVAALHRPGVTVDEFSGYAMGWFVRPLWEALDPARQSDEGSTLPTLLEHDGSWPNGRSFVAIVPSQGVGFAFLLNGGDPTVGSVADKVGWSLLRLLTGRDPWDPVADEDWLSQNARSVAIALVIAELVSLVLSLAWIARLVRRVTPPRTRRVALGLLAAGLLDVLVAYLVLVVLPEGYGLGLGGLFTYLPDIALAAALILGLALVWGPVRTLVVLALWGRRRRGLADPVVLPAGGMEAAPVPPA